MSAALQPSTSSSPSSGSVPVSAHTAAAVDARPDFDRLYREHFRFVWTSLLRLGVPRHGVEDALQETFLVVHRRLDDFEGRGSPRAWLFGIVRRVAFRSRRTRDRTQRKVSALAHERPDVLSVDDALARHQLSALLLEALDELDDDKRVALTLHVFDELSGPQIARMLGLKVDTAYSRIKAGRSALHRVLAKKGVDADVARLVRATRAETEPAPGTRKRVAALLLAQAPAASAAAPASLGWFSGSFSLGSSKVLLGVGTVVAAAVVGATQLASAGGADSPEPPSAVTSAESASRESAPSSRQRPAAPTAAPHPTEPAAAVGPAAVGPAAVGPAADERRHSEAPETHPATASTGSAPAPPQASSAALRAEVGLIERATAALRDDRPGDALNALAEHATAFPRGQLTAERRAYRAIALCAQGNHRQGRAEARLLLHASPPKALRARVEAGCDLREPTQAP